MMKIKAVVVFLSIFLSSITYGEEIKNIEFRLEGEQEPSIVMSDIKIASFRSYKPLEVMPELEEIFKDNEQARLDNETQFDVLFELNDAGTRKLNNLTRNNIGKNLAILINGNVWRDPIILEAIEDGRFSISGVFTREEAEELVSGINRAIGIAGAI